MLTGVSGVKYGLQPGAKQPKEKQQPALVAPKLAAFADEDDDAAGQATVSTQVARQAAQKAADTKVAKAHAAAIAEDPSVFDYDGVYDSMQQQRALPKQQEKIVRKSRYIESLLDKAKDRAQEQDIIYERKLARERAAEDYLFGDKDRFVTAAYKRKLQEDKAWVAADTARAQHEAAEDASRVGHMGNFYKNVLTNNAAFGTGAPAQDAAEAAPAGAPKREAEAQGGSGGAPGAAAADPSWEAARRARQAHEEAAAAGPAFAPAAAAAPASASARTPAGASDSKQQGEGSPRGGDSAPQHPVPASDAGPSGLQSGGREGTGSAAVSGEGPGGQKAPEEEAARQGPGGFAVTASTAEERAAKAEAARQRFLARKRKAPA